MLSRLLVQRWPVTAALLDPAVNPRGKQHYLDLKPEQRNLFAELNQALEPFHEGTKMRTGSLLCLDPLKVSISYPLREFFSSPSSPQARSSGIFHIFIPAIIHIYVPTVMVESKPSVISSSGKAGCVFQQDQHHQSVCFSAARCVYKGLHIYTEKINQSTPDTQTLALYALTHLGNAILQNVRYPC